MFTVMNNLGMNMTIIDNYNLIIKLVGQRVLKDASSGNEGVIPVESYTYVLVDYKS